MLSRSKGNFFLLGMGFEVGITHFLSPYMMLPCSPSVVWRPAPRSWIPVWFLFGSDRLCWYESYARWIWISCQHAERSHPRRYHLLYSIKTCLLCQKRFLKNTRLHFCRSPIFSMPYVYSFLLVLSPNPGILLMLSGARNSFSFP